MEWLKDASAGQWIVESTTGEFGGTIPNLLPQGFEAYVRVFHPMARSATGDESWEPVTWADAAADFGTPMGPIVQSAHVLGREDPWACDAVTSSSGWTYERPGDLTNLPAVVRVLADHTTTSTGVAAIWEGWGGLVSSQGRMAFLFAAPGGGFEGAITRAALTIRSAYQRVRSRFAFREARPGTGVLPADVATGPKLELPGRAYFLARLDLADLCADDWEQRAIWADPPFVRTPSLLWPDDHAWCLATEIDFDSTLIGGTAELAAALTAAPGLEAMEIDRNASLMWGSATPPGTTCGVGL